MEEAGRVFVLIVSMMTQSGTSIGETVLPGEYRSLHACREVVLKKEETFRALYPAALEFLRLTCEPREANGRDG